MVCSQRWSLLEWMLYPSQCFLDPRPLLGLIEFVGKEKTDAGHNQTDCGVDYGNNYFGRHLSRSMRDEFAKDERLASEGVTGGNEEII